MIINEAVARDDCCAGVVIKCSTHNSRLGSLDAISMYEDRESFLRLHWQIFLFTQMATQMTIHYQNHDILILLQYGDVFVLSRI